MPRFGYTPTTQYYVKPVYIGMNAVPIGDASDKILFKSPAITVTQGTVNNFWNKAGNLSKEELIKQGHLRKGPAGQHIVIIDGKPMGSFERIFLPNKPKELLETPKLTESEKVIPLLTGDERVAQLEKGWNEASKSIETLKAKHPVKTETTEFDDVTKLNREQEAQRLLSEQGLIEQPLTRHWLDQNTWARKYVERTAEGREPIPINLETGEPMVRGAIYIDENGMLHYSNKEPGLGSMLAYEEAIKSGNNYASTNIAKEWPFIETFRGNNPMFDRETILPTGDISKEIVRKGTGDFIYSTNNPWAAVGYGRNLTHDQYLYVMKFLKDRGYPITDSNIDFGLAVLENMFKAQIKKGVQLGGLSEKDARTGLKVLRTSEGRGLGDTDAKRIGSLIKREGDGTYVEWTPQEQHDYLNSSTLYSRFFGPEQGAYGGANTALIRRRPLKYFVRDKNYVNGKGSKFDEIKGNFYPFDNKEGYHYNGAWDLQKKAGPEGWDLDNIDILNFSDPVNGMSSSGTRPNLILRGRGMKRGGKLLS